MDEQTRVDETRHFDGEFNEEVIPVVVWNKLLDLYAKSHGNMHRGHYYDMFTFYVEGVSDALYLNRVDVEIAVKLRY